MAFDEVTVKRQWDGKCKECAKSLSWDKRGDRRDDSWEADHIRPLSEGGNNSDSNCQILCWPCHDKKTSVEAKVRNQILKKHLERS